MHTVPQKHTQGGNGTSFPTQPVELERSPDEVSCWKADRVRIGWGLSSI